MDTSHVLRSEPFPSPSSKRRVLVTGAAGRIGSYFAALNSERYQLRLMVRGDEPNRSSIEEFGEVVQCDLSDLQGLRACCADIDTVVHLAADHRTYATWEELLPNNIVGTHNLFESAKLSGCRRVIFASSVQAVNSYPQGTLLQPDFPVNPNNLYGASKCFGEALCRVYSNQGMSTIVLRIAAYETYESMRRPGFNAPLSAFVSHRDLTQLIGLCVDDLRLQFAVFYGLSNNKPCIGDLTNARLLIGYNPIDNIFDPLVD